LNNWNNIDFCGTSRLSEHTEQAAVDSSRSWHRGHDTIRKYIVFFKNNGCDLGEVFDPKMPVPLQSGQLGASPGRTPVPLHS
jgi:hypothetical protein